MTEGRAGAEAHADAVRAGAPLEAVDHPAHYGGAASVYEAIKVIEAWELGFHIGNAVKYIARAGKKGGPGQEFEDLKKAQWYISRRIRQLETSGEQKS